MAAPITRWPKKRTTVAAALSPDPMRKGAPPKITIAPPFVDRRFEVKDQAPVFSGLRPGQYPMKTGSAIARAYGEDD